MAIEISQLDKLLEGNGIKPLHASIVRTTCRHKQAFSFLYLAIDRRELLNAPPVNFRIEEFPNGRIEAVKDGKSYPLGTKQGQIIKALHTAYISKRVWLRGQDLMADVGSSPEVQVKTLFRRKPDVWHALVVSNNQGCFRLNI